MRSRPFSPSAEKVYRPSGIPTSSIAAPFDGCAACSIILSVSFFTTIACSGVGWQAAAPNATAMQSRIAMYLLIITSSVAPCQINYAAIDGVDAQQRAAIIWGVVIGFAACIG